MSRAIIFDFNRTLFNPQTGNLFPGARAVLIKLKNRGLILGLISYGNQERVELLKRLGFFEIFDWVKVVFEKNPSDFMEFLQKFNCESSETMVIGDRVDEELNFGWSLGLKTVWFNPESLATPGNFKPDVEIASLKELLSII